MFQCIGLATEEDGGCGEDWWHPECVLGLGRGWLGKTVSEAKPEDPPSHGEEEETEEAVHPLPPGFPQEEDFEAFVCYKCVDANPWIKGYAGSPGFLMPVFRKTAVRHPDVPKDDQRTQEQRNAMTGVASNHSLDGKQMADERDEDLKG